MTREEANKFLTDISYKLGNMAVEYLTEKDGEKMREAIKSLEQQTCEDAVSREDVLMALTGEWTESTDELIHRFIKRIKNLPSVNPQPKIGWIPVSERLPEEQGNYLVTRDGNLGRSIVDIATWFKYETANNGFHKANRVTAWMPLPEPYEPQESEV